MSHLSKPFYRIARPLFTENREGYLHDPEYAPSRDDQIRTAFYLEDQIVSMFEYIEPAEKNENVFSNKMWQLLVQICMEVESNFKLILSSNGYQKTYNKTGSQINKPLTEVNCNIKDDYYKVNTPMKLHLYSVCLQQWRKNGKSEELELKPFKKWESGSYDALTWYKSYNSVKHNRLEKFEEASFINMLNSFAALRVLLYAQFLSISCSRRKMRGLITSEIDELILNGGSSGERELYGEEGFFNESVFEVTPLNTSDWNDSEKYRFDWRSFTTNKYDKYNF